MKKILVTTMCIIMAIAIVACSGNSNKVQNNNKTEVAGGNIDINKTTYFGKVKNIVGNEIELELAENQDNPESEEGSGKVESSDELGPGVSVEDFVSDMSGGGDEGGNVDGGSYNGEESDVPKLELKYTGESKNITIQAGVTIFDLRTGDESKMSAIKKGSVIRIYATGTSDSPIVSLIEIVE